MWELIWIFEIIAIGFVLWYKSQQPPMTQQEIEREWEIVEMRKNSFLMNTTKFKAYNGMED